MDLGWGVGWRERILCNCVFCAEVDFFDLAEVVGHDVDEVFGVDVDEMLRGDLASQEPVAYDAAGAAVVLDWDCFCAHNAEFVDVVGQVVIDVLEVIFAHAVEDDGVDATGDECFEFFAKCWELA